MRIDEVFRAAYRELEARMKALAEADDNVFLPNLEPSGPVEYVLICMEPSLGRWARSADEARSKVAAGFRNFISSIEDFILHFCIQQYLCEPTQRYHITDLSKGAMLVERAGIERTQRYDRWYGLLVEELQLVAKAGAGIFAVGNAVAKHLARRAFPQPFTKVIHYSGQAARARAAGIVGHEDGLEEVRRSVSLKRVLATAEVVLMASAAPASFRDATLARLAKSQLSESRQRLIFNYKLAFEAMRTSGRVDEGFAPRRIIGHLQDQLGVQQISRLPRAALQSSPVSTEGDASKRPREDPGCTTKLGAGRTLV
jgi:hypothetical protein